MKGASKGKIGRLPREIRQELCERKRDGASDRALVDWLNGLPRVREVLKGCRFGGAGHKGEITDGNLSEYFRAGGPYEQWLQSEENVENTQRLSEFSLRLAEATGGMVTRPAVSILAGKILESLEGIGTEDRDALVKSLTGLTIAEASAIRAQTDRERLAVQQQTLSLDQAKFRHKVATDALALFEDSRAREIAEGTGNRAEKVARLVEYMEAKEKEERP